MEWTPRGVIWTAVALCVVVPFVMLFNGDKGGFFIVIFLAAFVIVPSLVWNVRRSKNSPPPDAE